MYSVHMAQSQKWAPTGLKHGSHWGKNKTCSIELLLTLHKVYVWYILYLKWLLAAGIIFFAFVNRS